jgi:hypothetical protein
MSGLARAADGAHDVRARDLHQFPVTLDLKLALNSAAFHQVSPPLRKFHATQLDIWATRTACDRIIGRQTP